VAANRIQKQVDKATKGALGYAGFCCG